MLVLFEKRFKCQECGAWYEATWEQSPEPALGTFTCTDCGSVVHPTPHDSLRDPDPSWAKQFQDLGLAEEPSTASIGDRSLA
jgi:hypothetical protein